MMQWFVDAFNSVKDFIGGLSTEAVALLSILVTLLIFLFGQRSETRFKKVEVRRLEYRKFIELLKKFTQAKSTDKIRVDEKLKQEFFETGVSLLLYGSKRVYKKYVFFRSYATNPLIQNNKHNNSFVGIYVIADILKAIRHEVGMTVFSNLDSTDALAFFVNDISMNPLSKAQSYKASYDIFMLKTELFFINRVKFTFIKKIYYFCVKPFFGIIALLLKYLLVIPFGKLLRKIFPKLAKKIEGGKDET